MEATVGTWGRSYAVRIPSTVVRQLGLKEGETLKVKVDDGMLTMKPKRKTYDLEEMLKNMEGQTSPELEWGDIDPLPSEWPVD